MNCTKRDTMEDFCSQIKPISLLTETVQNEMIELTKKIMENRSSKPILEREELNKWIVDILKVDNNQTEEIRKILHKWGFILEYSTLSYDKIILDPKWLGDLLKTIISIKHIKKNKE